MGGQSVLAVWIGLAVAVLPGERWIFRALFFALGFLSSSQIFGLSPTISALIGLVAMGAIAEGWGLAFFYVFAITGGLVAYRIMGWSPLVSILVAIGCGGIVGILDDFKRRLSGDRSTAQPVVSPVAVPLTMQQIPYSDSNEQDRRERQQEEMRWHAQQERQRQAEEEARRQAEIAADRARSDAAWRAQESARQEAFMREQERLNREQQDRFMNRQ